MPTYHKAREENERLKREISRLQDEIDQLHIRLDKATKDSREDRAENEQLRRGPEHCPVCGVHRSIDCTCRDVETRKQC